MPIEPTVLTVSQTIKLCNTLFDGMQLKVEGEVTSYSLNQGKFIFFDLKDENEEAKLGCFMMAFQLSTPIEDGMRVIVYAKPGIYPKNGQFRLTVTKVEPKGEGSLKRSFELLRAKLQAEGLFDQARKRPIPRFVSRVGVISSSEAAGFGDFKKIAFQRLPGIKFYFVPVSVQGKEAEREISQAFDSLNSTLTLDAIVLIRGGGSLEDLQAFNGEAVARSIVRSKVPVMVGVGHEKDITIADYCADVRASTPSNAAQLLLPTKEEVQNLVIRLTQDGQRRVEQEISRQRQTIQFKVERMKQKLLYEIQNSRQLVQNLIKQISALSPQETLNRGYSLTAKENGELVTKATQLKPGEKIVSQFSSGKSYSRVEENH
jgi:exodeoxyribonuclease VII large subunit